MEKQKHAFCRLGEVMVPFPLGSATVLGFLYAIYSLLKHFISNTSIRRHVRRIGGKVNGIGNVLL